jgi:hypothetical protein
VPSVRVGQDAEIVVLRQRCESSNVNSTDVSGTGEAFETLAAVVVLEEEREAGVGFGPDAVAVGADDLTPLSGTAPFGPPLVEPTAGRVRADPSREQKNPLRPTRCARRWLTARSWTRLRRQERSARTTP